MTGNGEGPWSYWSTVEDFELTYRIRSLGYLCQVSPTVRAYTDAMKTYKALWSQRMKWQTGTVQDLVRFGVNRLTLLDWLQQVLGLLQALTRFGWPLVVLAAIVMHTFVFQPLWLFVPLFFALTDTIMARRIPHVNRKDFLTAAALVFQETFAYLRAAWFIASWVEVLSGRTQDRWRTQYQAEGV
jgi:cellulose synthase/poly-beta-1,6-N-acetylglucosamine synthase-like glycosyltransferase